jgi:hypothetical protein
VSAGLRLRPSAWRMIVGFGVAGGSAVHRQVLRRDPCALGERADAAGLKPDNLATGGHDRPKREGVGLGDVAFGGLGDRSERGDCHQSLPM